MSLSVLDHPIMAPAAIREQPSLDALLADAESALSMQVAAQETLLALLDEERHALTHLRVEVIHECTARKVALAEEAKAAERECQRAVRALHDHVVREFKVQNSKLKIEKQGSEPVRLSELLPHLPSVPRRHAVGQLRDRLVALVTRVAEGQRRNEFLTGNFLSVLSRSMGAVQQSTGKLSTYTVGAKVEQAKWRGCVLRQTA